MSAFTKFQEIYSYISVHWNTLSTNQPTLTKICKIFGYTTAFLLTRKIVITFYRKYKKYPPGPVGIPFFGLFFSMRPSNLRYLNVSIGTQYYPVAMTYIGPERPTVIINDFNLYYKHFKHSDFSHRPPSWTRNRFNIPANLAFINGKNWAKRRKIFYNSLLKITDSNYITSHVQHNIKNQIIIPSIENAINQKNGKWFPRDPLINFCFHTIFGASFGPKFVISPNDDNYKRFHLLNKKLDDTFVIFLISTYFSEFAIDLYYKVIGAKGVLLETRSILNKWIDEYSKNKQNINDIAVADSKFESYVDIMLNSDIDREEAISDIAGVFGAGTNTTRQSIELALFAAAKYPDIQNKIYMELRGVFNNSLDINIENMSQLNGAHYLRALVEECWRTRDIAGLPRVLPKDYRLDFVDCNGNKDYYILPKGCFVGYNNIFNAQNSKYWKAANSFDVSNYLDENNKFIKSSAKVDDNDIKYKYSVFSYGGRQCPGISLARKEVLFTLAILLYKYQFHGPNGLNDTDFIVPSLLNGVEPKELPLTVTKR